jgi:methionyl-tRNA formyltransferase
MGRFMSSFLEECKSLQIHDEKNSRVDIVGVDIVGFGVLSPIFKKSTLDELKVRYSLYGCRDFILMASHISLVKLFNKLFGFHNPLKEPSLKMILDREKVQSVPIDDVNGEPFQKYLRENVDVLISVACPKILKRKTLESPSLSCLNYHTGALPKYRGRQPLFWAMLNGEKEIGITVHEMAEGLDAGGIIEQQMVNIAEENRLHAVYQKTIELGPTILVRALKKIMSGDKSFSANDDSQATKYRFPEKKDGVRFRSKGLRIY